MNVKNNILLKVCGMRHADNIMEVAALAPDYMGFIFYKKSKRFVGDHFTIPTDFPASIKKVGVFVNENTREILDAATTHSLNCIQLHGDEPVEQCRELKNEGYQIIKVFHIDKSSDFKETSRYKNAVNYFMFDTQDMNYGGSGRTFPWELLESYDREIPFFLSGGISPELVGKAISLGGMNLHALDINSKVEKEPGIKDPEQVKKIKNEMKKS